MNGETHSGGGIVHRVRTNKVGDRVLLEPICRKYRLDELISVTETDDPVTCKRCLTRLAKQTVGTGESRYRVTGVEALTAAIAAPKTESMMRTIEYRYPHKRVAGKQMRVARRGKR